MSAAVANDVPVKDNVVKKSQLKQKKRNKKKTSKQRRDEEAKRKAEIEQQINKEKDVSLDNVEIEYVVQPVDVSALKNMDGMSSLDENTLQQFSDIFKHFQTGKPDEDEEEFPVHDNQEQTEDNDGESNDEEKESDLPLSKKKLKKIQRLTVAELKQLVKKPEAVEWWDVTATDPRLLVALKSYRNTVPVPAHWSQKRKYLQGKRGIEKPPWELPDFIKDTGIMEMRDAVKEKESAAGLKSKMKEKVAPKMGKLDIDYQKLHDAFFRFQTKSKYTMHGELYYEGKEFETKLKEQKPGQLSEELKEALNMPPLAPPPWLINMQRYGPPPSYPSLKIAGLNAPIPEGAQWGYHPGGWGRPPVDEFNRPLYGDVFGVTQPNAVPPEIVEPVDKKIWGELESEDEYEEEEEEEEEEESEAEEEEESTEADNTDLADGLVTPSGMSSIASGLETPDHIELRKDRVRDEDEGPKQLYQVLPEVQKNISGFMGSQHGYDLSTVDKPIANVPPGRSQSSKRKVGENVDVAIDPSELESGLDEATLRAKYDAQMKAKKPVGVGEEDLSDMYAEHASRQAKKAKTQDSRKEGKKKEFKF
ncbi:hypothetical protein BDF21DRAFT_430488 [Thamnidium elegans]|uniref:PSP proline-rich domain-containing protein n=1 Tax=Thamnidium elegans TaxID=101142 RepID=A0A8H7SIV8_9FUNG|nr:hypothetical protein INT48_000557 [Thamnidium elegans]KAI8057493.1 hypothetical protein BDF21DRAFT_430488 [Thamnidium elegans]